MPRHIHPQILKPIAFIALMVMIVLLTGTIYAAPKVGPITPENSIIGSFAGDSIGSRGVYVLPNGNAVILSPNWNNGRGAVTCLTPEEYQTGGIVVSSANSLSGSTSGDYVGEDGITILSNGNYVVMSYSWQGGKGAATWVNGNTCLPHGEISHGAVVSAANSLVGSVARDEIGGSGVIALTNGNYVVSSPQWSNDQILEAGAATWGNGTTGIAGMVSPANSLIGSTTNDRVGRGGVTALANGNYVVSSSLWDNGTKPNAGAATWGNGATGIVGTINETNSLVGTREITYVGGSVTALSNGNYVVISPAWANGVIPSAGAVTWGNGATGIVGAINETNSLVGSGSGDQVGAGGVTALSNGNYVVRSYYWNDGISTDVGAATWGNGTTGTVGLISSANSLVGTKTKDYVSSGSITALTNGNYVVSSPQWDNNGVPDTGAVTWGDGATGSTGIVSAANSLVGSTESDFVGEFGATALTNGNYVVALPHWHNAQFIEVGAVTWGNGTGNTVGAVSPANSLVGSASGDRIGYSPIIALTNGNYVISSPYWNNGSINDAGAVTWGNGTTGTVGELNPSNSLVGSSVDDLLSYHFPSYNSNTIVPLANGNYVVLSAHWNHNGVEDAGAVTWGNGITGTVGTINATNSLVGIDPYDSVGGYDVKALANGNYVVSSPFWDNGVITYAGAITWGNGTTGTTGTIDATNSLIGSSIDDKAGYNQKLPLPDGRVLISIALWDDGASEDVGMVIWSDGMVKPSNYAPELLTIGDQTVDEGSTLTFDAEATDADEPAQTLTYSITGAPEDASFDTATGEFSWTPGEADGGQVFNVTVTVTDNRTPALSDSELFTITVNEVNDTPVLAEINDKTVDVGGLVTFYAEATDADDPVQTLTFSITGAPEDASFDTSTGEFSWTADETDGGQTFNVTVTVTDNGEPALNDSGSFMITVNDVNDAPVLAEIGDQTVDVGATVTFDAEATDADDPAQTLTFSITGAPEDASFDTATGAFSWTAGEDDGGQVFNVTMTVTDNGEPAANDSEDFTITVNPVVVEETNYLPNASFENAGTTNKTAAGWNSVGLTTNDKRICDTETKTYAHDGECAFRFQFNGASNPTRTLQRNLNVNNFAKNDVVQLRGMVKANNLTAGARLIVKVVYNNGKTEAVNVKLTAGSYDYTPFATQITLKRPAKKITVQIKAGSAKGIFFVDDMAVVKVATPLTIDDGATNSGLRGLD